MKSYTPTLYVGHFTQLTPALLSQRGVRFVLTDLDETLVGHGETHPTEEVKRWVCALRAADIGLCIISNNSEKRIAPFAAEANVMYFCRAKKPSARRISLLMTALALKPEEVCFVGDQLYTDIGAAENLGVPSVLVDPIIGQKHHVFVDLRRALWERKIRQTLRKDIEQ